MQRRAHTAETSRTRPVQHADVVGLWAAAVMRAVARRLHRRPDADDVAMRVVRDFFELSAVAQRELIDRHPDPVAYARLVASRALIDHDRTERVQQCRGARLYRQADGSVAPGRSWAYADAPMQSGGESLFDLQSCADVPVDELVADRVDAARHLHRLLDGLTDDERILLQRIDGLGHRVCDIAAERHIARETLSKKVSSARLRVQNNRERGENGGMASTYAIHSGSLAAAGVARLALRR